MKEPKERRSERPEFVPVKTISGQFPLLRQSDFAASRFKSGKGLIRPEYYFLTVRDSRKQPEEPGYEIQYRVSAQELKGFIRELTARDEDALVWLYGTIMPEAKGMEVNKMIVGGRKLDVAGRIRDIAIGAYKVLNQLHEHGFAHNDIKPNNMFLDPDSLEVTFIDTGLTQKHSRGEARGRKRGEAGKLDYVNRHSTIQFRATLLRGYRIKIRTVRKRIITPWPARC